ncbi:MAG: hypothetical protein MPW14_06620 [Candidatus Manganitrophus sp.]|nr:MAG: hypothetical protein MPW14_06620 [Candidatus Manganitrophus sp.]
MFKSYFWVLHLAMIAAGAYFIADMANVAIGSRPEASIAPPKRRKSRQCSSGRIERDRPGLQRHCRRKHLQFQNAGKTTGSRGAERGPVPSGNVGPRVPLNQTLLGTMVGSDEESYAVIEDTKTREQLLYRIGDVVGEDGRIAKISRNKVVVLRGAKRRSWRYRSSRKRTNRPGTPRRPC